MIKLFIKHHIYEKCIEILFNAITDNFSNVIRLSDLTLGDYLSEIIIKRPDGNIILRGATVVDIDEFRNIRFKVTLTENHTSCNYGGNEACIGTLASSYVEIKP